MTKRLSDLVFEINIKIETCGDLLIQSYSISDELEYDKWKMLSPNRKLKSGMRAPMNLKEFKEFCNEENSK